jgi:hypothetical protein
LLRKRLKAGQRLDVGEADLGREAPDAKRSEAPDAKRSEAPDAKRSEAPDQKGPLAAPLRSGYPTPHG